MTANAENKALRQHLSNDVQSSMRSLDASVKTTQSAYPQTWSLHWKVLILAQLLSFLLAASSASQATLHLDCHLSAPAFATGLVYVLLAFLMIPLYCRRRGGHFDESMTLITSTTSSQQQDMRDTEGLEGFGAGGNTTTTTANDNAAVTTTAATTKPRTFMGIPLQTPALAYFGLALLDVEANYLTVLAFKYTTLTSVVLFDALAIPSAMLFSKFCLVRHYKWAHILGAAICMGGIIVNVLTDYESAGHESRFEKKEYPHKMVGDVLAIAGGILYGANNVLQEYCVKASGGPMEYLALLGFFGVLISLVQVLLLERAEVSDLILSGFEEHHVDEVETTCAQHTGRLLLAAYVVSLWLFYIGVACFLLVSESALLNLSLLTADMWSVTFSIVAERIMPPGLFYLALVLIVSGVFLYETAPSPIVEDEEDVRASDDFELVRPPAAIA